jgi:tetratricopeptide (TPR) repeat protein
MDVATHEPPTVPIPSGADTYARLLLRLHQLAAAGQDDGREADAIRDEMTTHWYRMSAREQERMIGLSADLYTIEEGGARSQLATIDELQQFRMAAKEAFDSGDPDRQLAFLRRPYPKGQPAEAVPFLQARAWERAGNLDVAIIFMKEAERRNPEYGLFVMMLLERRRRWPEAEHYARKFLDDPLSPPGVVYLAAGVFIQQAQQVEGREARAILDRLIPPLRSAWEQARKLPRANGNADHLAVEAGIATSLGLCLDLTGRVPEAIEVYDVALGVVTAGPDLHLLLTMRGIARLNTGDTSKALGDFRRATSAGAAVVWPYYFLAAHEMQQEQLLAALKLCNQVLERVAIPKAIQAEMYGWVATIYALLNQPPELVRWNFDLAERLDPHNATIRDNRALYEESLRAEDRGIQKRFYQPSQAAMIEAARRAIMEGMEVVQQSNRLAEREAGLLLAA